MLNFFSYNAGPLLALPIRQVISLPELAPDERAELMETTVIDQNLLTERLQPDGPNVGFTKNAEDASSSSLFHSHIVSRREGDTNFMPVHAKTRVLPASLEAMGQRLREVFATQKGS